jgi:hypothetical protein
MEKLQSIILSNPIHRPHEHLVLADKAVGQKVADHAPEDRPKARDKSAADSGVELCIGSMADVDDDADIDHHQQGIDHVQKHLLGPVAVLQQGENRQASCQYRQYASNWPCCRVQDVISGCINGFKLPRRKGHHLRLSGIDLVPNRENYYQDHGDSHQKQEHGLNTLDHFLKILTKKQG